MLVGFFMLIANYFEPGISIDLKNTNKTPKLQAGTYLNVPRQVFSNSGLPLTVLLPVKKGITTVTINFFKAYSLRLPSVGPVIISLARGLALKKVSKDYSKNSAKGRGVTKCSPLKTIAKYGGRMFCLH